MNSSTQIIPTISAIPEHIAIIMDGNGRWAKNRLMPRVMGHKKGLEALEKTVEECNRLGVKYLTVFAFSSENWRRPMEEVSFLMGLFLRAIRKYVRRLHENNIRLRVIGSREKLAPEIVAGIEESEKLTENNDAFTLTIAADYGGRWDILQAVNRLIQDGVTEVSENNILQYLSLGDVPEPDLYIRTGGESRVSNFLLWQMAYTEFYFSDVLWPDFNYEHLQLAIQSYQTRERRFGRTSEQLLEIDKNA